MSLEVRMDAMLPQEMAEKAEAAGIRKAALSFLPLFALAMLAGAFIGLGAMFATTTAAAWQDHVHQQADLPGKHLAQLTQDSRGRCGPLSGHPVCH